MEFYHTLGAHACLIISLRLLFASVGQASARIIASLTWTLFTSLVTQRLVLFCVQGLGATLQQFAWSEALRSFHFAAQWTNTKVTMYHLISQAGWNRCNL